MLSRHPAHRLPGAQKGAGNINRKNPVQAGRIHMFDPHLLFDDAGIVHQRSNRSERIIDGFEQANDIRFGAYIGWNGDRMTARLLDVARDRSRGFAITQVTDADE